MYDGRQEKMKPQAHSIKKINPTVHELTRILLAAAFCFMIIWSRHLQRGVASSLQYVGEVLIPSIFPFAVLSGIYAHVEKGDCCSRPVCRIASALHLTPVSLSALPLGLFAGFPLGGKYVVDLYNERRISKEEATRLFCMVNNPSAAFVIVGVGTGMLRSSFLGLLLFSAVLISGYTVGYIGKYTPPPSPCKSLCASEPWHLSALIRDATLTTVCVSGYVVFFSALTTVFTAILPNDLLRMLIVLPAEVTGGCAYAASLGASLPLRMCLLGFVLGFGGICVGMQSEIYLREGSLKVATYYKRKLAQGVLCAIVSFLFTHLFQLCTL